MRDSNTRRPRRTLLEDWEERRARLISAGGGDELRHDPHVRVLDYLLNRYRGSSVAQHPARPLLPVELHRDDRRIVVHHHLGGGQVGGVQSAGEANARMISILRRMQSEKGEQTEEYEPEHEQEPSYFEAEHHGNRGAPLRAQSVWKGIVKTIRRGKDADRKIQQALDMCTFLPSEILHYLAARLGDVSREDTRAFELLLQCQHEGISDRIVDAWSQRVIHCPPQDPIRAGLEKYFRDAERRTAAAEKMRDALAHENLQVRLAAVSLLEQFGSLHDISLLSDLLSLSGRAGPCERERDALIRAMQRLAERDE